MNEPIKVNVPYTNYIQRGLRLPAEMVPGEIGSVVVVFDYNLDFTRHYVLARDGEKVTLSGSLAHHLGEN